jgi:hypothetical protein
MSDADDVKRAVAIDQRNIQAEYCSLPSALSLWIFRRVEATKHHRLAELELEVLEENCKIDTRAANQAAVLGSIRDEKTGKPMLKAATVDEIDALVATNPSVVKAKRVVIDAAEQKEKCAGMVEALQAKQSMLVSLGADIRAEKNGDPSIRDNRPGGDNRPRKQWTGRR